MTKERVGSLIFLLFGIYGLIFSIQLSLGKLNEPGPGVFPLSLSILLCASGALWFIHGKRKEDEKSKIDWRGLSKKLVTPLQIVVVTAAFILTLEPLGYMVASSLYMFILLLWVSRYKLWIAMGLAIALGFGTWYFFEKILGIQLPKGIGI